MKFIVAALLTFLASTLGVAQARLSIGNGEMKTYCNGTIFESNVALKEDIDCSMHGFVSDPQSKPFPYPMEYPQFHKKNKLPFLFDLSQGSYELDCKGHTITLPTVNEEMGYGIHVLIGPGSRVKNCHFVGGTVGILHVDPAPFDEAECVMQDGKTEEQCRRMAKRRLRENKFRVENVHFKGPMLVGVGHHNTSPEGAATLRADLVNLHAVNLNVGVWWRPAAKDSTLNVNQMYMLTTHDGACLRVLHGNLDVKDFVCHRTVETDVEHHGEEPVIISSKLDHVKINDIPEDDAKYTEFVNGATDEEVMEE